MFQEYRANGFKKADYEYTRWAIRPPSGTPAEAVKLPEYWHNHNNLLKPGDILEVLAQDGSYEMELRVIATDRLWAKTRVRWEWHADSVEGVIPISLPLTRQMGDMISAVRQPVPGVTENMVSDEIPVEVEGLSLNFAPRADHKWRIVDMQTGDIVEKGHPTKAAAAAAREAYLKHRAA